MKRVCLPVGVLIVAACAACCAFGDVRLPAIIGPNMVLQQKASVPIWGWAASDETVTVAFGGQTRRATADANGKWLVKLSAMKANSAPQAMTITGKNTLKLENIIVGEVWICSGQSNMQLPVSSSDTARDATNNIPGIRLMTVPTTVAAQPAADVRAAWVCCDQKTAAGFSAVGYFFGRELHNALGVPVGLINSSWGGTRIEPWTPAEALESTEWGKPMLKAGLPVNSVRAAAIYNAMIAPLVPFGIRGAIWYQGESNCIGESGALYGEKMKALIGGWRKVWGQGDFPFYFVQLAPFAYKKGDALSKTRQEQLQSLRIPNTGMAVTTDLVSNLADIHPRNKLDVGKRLALWALAKTYGKRAVVYSGPLYKGMKVDGKKIRIAFDCTGSGLSSRDGKDLSCFEIAGADGRFLPAKAEIEGSRILVWNETITEPTVVRMGWNEVSQPNLMNKEGLPASPFCTR